jgi:SAM-dependent methyltransferase
MMMDKEQRDRIRPMVLACRKYLTEEFDRQLRLCGLLSDSKIDAPPQQQRIRLLLEEALNREGQDYSKARSRYIRSAAYTFLNRILALRVSEAHGLIVETIQTKPEYGDRSKRERDLADRESTLMANPELYVQKALQEAYNEASVYVPMLFREDDPYALLTPGLIAIRQVRHELDTLPHELWLEFETLGWAYQYFKSEENQEIRRRMRGAPQPDEAPIINQFFTVAWIVKALVHNSLGRLWLEAHPNSSLLKKLDYFVPLESNFQSPEHVIKIENLKVLDPACGSGHFLLGAFDLLLEMWKEEHPEIPIWHFPALILEHNIFGIDIDLRACQLAAAILYLKARTAFRALQNDDPGAIFKPKRINIVCADIHFTDGNQRARFLSQFEGDPQIFRIIEQTLQACDNAYEIGSLLEVRQPFEKLFSQRKKKPADWKEQEKQLTLFTPEMEQLSLGDVPIPVPKAFTVAEIVHRIQTYLKQATDRQDMGAEFYGMDAENALHLVDVLSESYDVILMNPPYGAMTTTCKAYVDVHFPRTHNDAYAAFIEQAIRLCRPSGYIGALTGRTFMFLRTFQKLREEILRSESLPELVWDLGFNVLDEATARYAAFTLRKRHDHDGIDWKQHPVTFFRLTDWAWDEKRVKFENALSRISIEV